MEYFRGLINTMDNMGDSQFKMDGNIAKSCISVIEQCEKIERELDEKLDEELLNQFNNYRKMIHAIVNGLVVEEIANAYVGYVIMENKKQAKARNKNRSDITAVFLLYPL